MPQNDFLAGATRVSAPGPADFLANATSASGPNTLTSAGAAQWRAAHTPPPEPSLRSLYGRALFNPVGSGAHPQGILGAAEQVGGQAMQTILSPLLHPIQAAKGAYGTIKELAQDAPNSPFYNPSAEAENPGPLYKMARSVGHGFRQNPALESENLAGTGLGMIEGGRLGAAGFDLAAPPLRNIASSISEAAKENPDIAALRAMRVPTHSPRHLQFEQDLHTTRPFVGAIQNLSDAQVRFPEAEAEIWNPYQNAIDMAGDRAVDGPDGPTTVRELENERQQLSAINRRLNSQTHREEGLQLAKQKGLTEAQSLAREQQVKNLLDPHLRNAGIDPEAIRSTFGAVKRVGKTLKGRSTLSEANKPYGLSRLLNPFNNIRMGGFEMRDSDIDPIVTFHLRNPLTGLRDIAAGRPWFRGKPTDIDIREGFRNPGPRPEFGALRSQPLLRASVPSAEFETPVPPYIITPIPREFPRLAASATPSEIQPMLHAIRSIPASRDVFDARQITSPARFRTPEIVPQRGFTMDADGNLVMNPRGLLKEPGEDVKEPPKRRTGRKKK